MGYIWIFITIYFFRENQPFYGYLALLFSFMTIVAAIVHTKASGDFDKIQNEINKLFEGEDMPLPTDKKDPEDKGRTMKEVSGDIQKANQEPEKPELPEPKPKTPKELLEDPAESVKQTDVTGD